MSANYSTNLVKMLNESVDDLVQAKDPATVKQVLNTIQAEARAQTDPIYLTDRWVYRITVAVLGMAVILVVIAQFLLSYRFANGIDIPDGIIAIGSAAIGALAGLLAPTSTGSNGDQPPPPPE